MTSIKVKFRPSASKKRPGSIVYQIIHRSSVRRFASDHRLFPSEWDERRSRIKSSSSAPRQAELAEISRAIRRDVDRLATIVRDLEDSRLSFDALDVIERFREFRHDYSLFTFAEAQIRRLNEAGKVRTAETYRAALSSFSKFRRGEDIMLDAITSDVMEAYEAWLIKRKLALNTVSFYTRILRAIYNRAVDAGAIQNLSPFRHVYTGIDKTVKRALSLSILRILRDMMLDDVPALDYARDLFFLSFFLRGMSFIDMAFLRKDDLRDGYICYRRRKTGQELCVKWTMQMQQILNKYPANPTHYLLPIIRTECADEREIYRNMACKINYHLKKLAAMAGIDVSLTMYVARHSWATIAKARGIPVSVISKGMGHDSEETTRIYLASLDTAAVDRANSKVIGSLD